MECGTRNAEFISKESKEDYDIGDAGEGMLSAMMWNNATSSVSKRFFGGHTKVSSGPVLMPNGQGWDALWFSPKLKKFCAKMSNGELEHYGMVFDIEFGSRFGLDIGH